MSQTHVTIQGEFFLSTYVEPFTTYFRSTWLQGPWVVQPDDVEWKAVIHLRDGETLEKTVAV
jgi:hypothetical protein